MWVYDKPVDNGYIGFIHGTGIYLTNLWHFLLFERLSCGLFLLLIWLMNSFFCFASKEKGKHDSNCSTKPANDQREEIVPRYHARCCGGHLQTQL